MENKIKATLLIILTLNVGCAPTLQERQYKISVLSKELAAELNEYDKLDPKHSAQGSKQMIENVTKVVFDN